MKYIFRFILLIHINCFSEEAGTFNFLKANEAVMKTLNTLETRNPGNLPTACHKIKDEQGFIVASCSISKDDFDSSLITKLDFEPNQIPDFIKKKFPDKFNFETQKQKSSCIFRFKTLNDNKQLLGCKNDGTSKDSKKKCGDDYGLTQETEVGVNCISEDGISSAYTYATTLYTDPVLSSYRKVSEGDGGRMQQNFTAENVIQFVQDNIQQNKATFWKRGIGFINLSEKDKWGILQSTGQQNWFHGLMNKIKPGVVTEYDNIEGQNDKWAGFISLAVGLQENRKIGDRCHLNYSAELNGQISNHKSMSSVGINLNGKISYLIGQDHNSLYLRINGNSQLSNNSNVGSATLAAGFKNPNGSFFEFGIVRPKGSNPNIKQDKPNIFNMKSDSLVFVQLGLLLN